MTNSCTDRKQYSRTRPVHRFRLIFFIFFAVSAGILVSSCTEKSTHIGLGMLPVEDFTSAVSTDTISAFSYTCSVDSTSSGKRTYSYIGGLYDPYFGTTSTGFVGQLRVLKDFAGGMAYVIDSVKMYMAVAGAKGVLGGRQAIKLYETDEQLYIDSVYYSNRDPHIKLLLVSDTLPVIKKDSIQDISFLLPDSVGRYLMRDTSKLFQDNPLTDFRSFFKGLYVQMMPLDLAKGQSKGSATDSLMLLSLTFDQSEFIIRVFYETAASKNIFYDFTVNPNSARYNLYSHDYSTAEPGKQINHVNDHMKDTLSYMQAFNGIFTRIEIPALETLKSLMPVSVNRARLIIPGFFDGTDYTTSTVATSLYLTYKDADGKMQYVPDYYINPAFFDGKLNTSTKKYTFNLASFVQLYLEGKIPKPELDMYLPEGIYKNSILKANNSSTKVTFEFTYTRF